MNQKWLGLRVRFRVRLIRVNVRNRIIPLSNTGYNNHSHSIYYLTHLRGKFLNDQIKTKQIIVIIFIWE